MNEAPATAPPVLREARLTDYEGIIRLGAAHSFGAVSFDDWRHLWQANPVVDRVGKSWPIGWVMESAGGEIVGSFSNVPSLCEFHGESLVCANSRAWVVAPAYRGFALWLLDEYFNQPAADLCISTTAGPLAQESLPEFARRIPVGAWNKLSYWITGHRTIARQGFERRGLPFAGPLGVLAGTALSLKDSLNRKPLPPRSGTVTVEVAERFDSRFDTLWGELRQARSQTLLAHRDAQTLSWHFALPLREKRLWILTASRNGRMVGYCICKRQPRSAVRGMRLIDYQSLENDTDLLTDFLHSVLAMCAADEVGIFENLGYGVPKMASLDRCAPHVRTLDVWPFFYQTNDEKLADELSRETSWDPSVFDGDASLE